MRKSVAELAAEHGLREDDLTQAVLHLARKKHVPYRFVDGSWLVSRPLLSAKQTADLLGLRQNEVKELIAPDPEWTRPRIVDALFAFYKREKRWPMRQEWLARNELPSPWKAVRVINPGHYGWGRRRSGTGTRRLDAWSVTGTWRRPWDVFQRDIAKDPRCTPAMALKLTNVLARKEAIERIGFDNLVKSGIDVTVVDTHPEFGTLYSLPGETPEERMYLVKVVNSTAEPDGTFSDYYLRVPPYENVQMALAWTFRLDTRPEHEYRPLVET